MASISSVLKSGIGSRLRSSGDDDGEEVVGELVPKRECDASRIAICFPAINRKSRACLPCHIMFSKGESKKVKNCT